MRDWVLDRIVQPAIARMDLDPMRTSMTFSAAFAAISIADSTRNMTQGGDAFGCALKVVVSAILLHVLTACSRSGSGILSTPFGAIHMIARLGSLGIAASILLSTLIILLNGHAGPEQAGREAIAAMLLLCLSGSLYAAVCDEPPRRRPDGLRT